jgi:hypothetical protein
MSTYVCVPKSALSDDILEGLVNTITPATIISSLHKSFVSKIDGINKKKQDALSTISSLFASDNYIELRDALNNSDAVFLSGLKSVYENVESEEAQVDYVKEHHPNVNILNSTFSSFTFEYTEDLSLSYKDTQKSDFWEIKFKPRVTVSLLFTDKTITINRIGLNIGHPYAGSDNFLKNVSKINISNKYYLDQVIKFITGHITTYKLANFIRPISDFIGQKCSITGLYTYKDGVKCHKTEVHMLRSAAKEINGRYYSPAIIKKCTKCEKESPSWISKNKEIICGECYDN